MMTKSRKSISIKSPIIKISTKIIIINHRVKYRKKYKEKIAKIYQVKIIKNHIIHHKNHNKDKITHIKGSILVNHLLLHHMVQKNQFINKLPNTCIWSIKWVKLLPNHPKFPINWEKSNGLLVSISSINDFSYKEKKYKNG